MIAAVIALGMKCNFDDICGGGVSPINVSRFMTGDSRRN